MLHLFHPWTPLETVLGVLIAVGFVFSIVAVPRLLLERRESTATLSWLLAIVLLPLVGISLYWLIGSRRIQRVRRMRSSRVLPKAMAAVPYEAAGPDPAAPALPAARVVAEAARMAVWLTGSSSLTGNRAELLIDGESTYSAIETAIRGATDHVHLLYYIFNCDRTGHRFRDLLVQKARAGVEVRLLVDDVGSFSLNRRFLEPLEAAGARVARFLPVNPLERRFQHVSLRNHRKIVVVDGRIGFTGGINIGDEYLSGGRRRNHWRDTHVRMEGPAVLRLQEVFAEDWHFATDQDLVRERYFPHPQEAGDEFLQVVASGPDQHWEVIHHLLFTAITSAEKSVLITTPYFVPDRAMEVALVSAAMRGVDVRILIPRRSDSRLLDHTAQSFLPDLLLAGVRVFSYGAGMMHAKTVVIDGVWSTVGSANMDIRSFRLNFEANLVIYSEHFGRTLERSIRADFENARELSIAELVRKPKSQRLLEGACRILAPIL